MKIGFFNTGFPKVTFAFVLVIIIVLVNVIFNYYIIQKNKATIAQMTEVINPYIASLEELNLVVTESKMYATNWVYLQNSVDDKKNLDSLHKFHHPQLKKKLDSFFEKLDKQSDRDSLQTVFAKFDKLIAVEKEIMQTLVGFDDYENAQKKFKCEEMIESEVLPRTQEIMNDLDKIVDRNRAEALQMKADVEKASHRMMTIMMSASVFLFVFIFFAVSFISSSIRQPILNMKRTVQQLAKGELSSEKISMKDKNVVAEMVESVNILSDSFTKTSTFANEIGKGNLTVDYQKLSENDVLGDALINMRNSLYAYSADMENKVKERTQEVLEKSEKLELAYKEIRDSINYAKRIQESILPADEMINKVFGDSFIFYRPKDIVCGDFYWFAQRGDEAIIAAVDCTGHGVPGALMTVIGNSILNQIIAGNETTDPAGILTQLDKKLHDTFKQHGNVSTNDGMDAAIVRYRINKREIAFAGAKRPLYIFKNAELLELKGNKSPIGSFNHNFDKLFTTQKMSVNAGDTIYLFSDGLQDQFGGDGGKKFMIKRFRDLLVEIQPMSMKDQLKRLEKEMDIWQGKYEQTDDMLLVGIRF
ncbi:MAG TPA: SpoIIE family protein phosphatase [Bacteroidia bacterium]|jgi:serine phosphatase RsbU (regulator of sigma subunit)|nr:SpoIIE family protein phosphatase [Bacteroidia bacterium]